MELAKMTSKGQLTVPASIRKKLGIGTGDQLLFYERDGQIAVSYTHLTLPTTSRV